MQKVRRESVKDGAAKVRPATSEPARAQPGAKSQVVSPFSPAGVQRQVKVGAANDPAEHEAERVASRVASGPAAVPAISRIESLQRQVLRTGEQVSPATEKPPVQRLESAHSTTPQAATVMPLHRSNETKPDESVHSGTCCPEPQRPSGTASIYRKVKDEPAGGPAPARKKAIEMDAAAAHAIASKGMGQPLRPQVRQALESRMGVKLSGVRVHEGPSAHESAAAINARAFTHKKDIWLGRGESQENLRLMAHETTHVIQQGGATKQPRRTARHGSEESVHRESAPVQENVPAPRVQRLGFGDILDYIADHANAIPGFRMFTIVLGVNPINMSPVDRSGANVLRAVIEFIPGGALITKALDTYGALDKAGAWVDQQLATLNLAGSAIKRALDEFINSLHFSDIFHPGDVWDRAVRIFSEPIDRIKNFVVGLAEGIIQFIKDAILMPIAKLAEGTRGWDLLIAVLGKNPITQEEVPRTPDTLIGGFMKLIGEEEVWNNLKNANAVPRAWAWFQGVLGTLLGFVSQIPSLFIQAVKSLVLPDLIVITNAFAKVAGVFGKFISDFIKWAGDAVWQLLQIIFEVVAPGAIPYLKKLGAAFKSVLKNPIGFVGNLVKAAKLGFQQFADNIGAHLKASFIEWLTGSLPGVYIPKALEFKEILAFVLSVLGLTWQNIRQKLVKLLGEPAVKVLETGFDIVVTLVKDGPAAAWDKIKQHLSDLKDMVMQGIMDFVIETIVKKAVAKVLSLFVPGGAFIQAIISIYDTVMVFVDKLAKIGQVVKAFLDSMMEIASGAIGSAAAKVESTLAGLLTLAINFLAGFLGLGNIAEKVMGIINTKVRQPLDQAIDKFLAWVVTAAKTVLAKLSGKKDKDGKPGEGDHLLAADFKQPFSMGSRGHTVEATLKDGALKLTIASDDDVLTSALASAIAKTEADQPKREPSQKKAILSYLNAAASQASSIAQDWIATEARDPRGGDKKIAFQRFMQIRITQIINQLRPLAKYKIEDLHDIITAPAERKIPSGYNIRGNLYDRATGGRWTTLSESWKKPEVAKISAKCFAIWTLRDDTSKPGNYAAAELQWKALIASGELDPEQIPTFSSYDHPKHFSTFKYQTDHKTPLGAFWNSGENNKQDSDRSATTLDTSNFQLLTPKANREKSGVPFNRNVGPEFTSDVANSPKDSRTLDGIAFEEV